MQRRRRGDPSRAGIDLNPEDKKEDKPQKNRKVRIWQMTKKGRAYVRRMPKIETNEKKDQAEPGYETRLSKASKG